MHSGSTGKVHPSQGTIAIYNLIHWHAQIQQRKCVYTLQQYKLLIMAEDRQDLELVNSAKGKRYRLCTLLLTQVFDRNCLHVQNIFTMKECMSFDYCIDLCRVAHL